MTDPVPAAAVANEFFDLQSQEERRFDIDPMKLQKLIYYSHAWYLANRAEPLIQEPIEAWAWGPVVRSVYVDFLECRNRPIVGKRAVVYGVDLESDEVTFDLVASEPALEDRTHKRMVSLVWDNLKGYSGIQLSNSTHGDKEPWSIVRKQYGGNLDSKPIIPTSLIEAAFKAKIAK